MNDMNFLLPVDGHAVLSVLDPDNSGYVNSM